MRLLIFITILAVGACKTTRPDAAVTAPETLPKFPDLGSVPEHFWSTDQRRISAIYNYLVGEYTLLKGDVHTSHDAFAKAYSLDPSPFLGGKSIATLAELGHLDQALTESRKMVLLHPKDTYLRFLYGQILAQTGFPHEAKVQLEKAIQLDRYHIASYHSLVDLLVAQNNLPTALRIAQEMVQDNPSAVGGWSKLSRIHLMLGQKKDALAPAKTAFSMQSTNPTFILVYAYTLELNGLSQEAISMYERLYQANATNEKFIRHLAGLYRQLGGLEQALELLEELAKRTPQTRIGVGIQRVVILWELKEYDKAHDILLSLLKEHPHANRIVYMTALSDERRGRHREALARYQTLRDDNEFASAARFRAAVIYHRREELEFAKREMRDLIDGEKTKWEFYAFLANIHGKQKNYAQALRVLAEGEAKYPRIVPLLFLKGVYQEKAGNIKGCMRSMRVVIELDPRHSDAYNYLGYLLAEQNKSLEEALHLILRALEIKPHNGYYLDSLAWVYYRLEAYEEAHINILKALRYHPTEAVIVEHYADILLKLNRPAEALLVYRKAYRYFENDADRDRVRRKITDLEKNS